MAAQAIILLPLLLSIANIDDSQAGHGRERRWASSRRRRSSPLLIVGGLTGFAFVTGANFSWLGGVVTVGVLGDRSASSSPASIFGFTLGLAFIVLGVVHA